MKGKKTKMKTYYYFGPNYNNQSRVSFKMWKIVRLKRRVTVMFGAATIDRRKVTPTGTLQTRSWTFRTEAAAKADEERRVAEKLKGGYERQLPRKKS